jgi:hypothetical protein
MKMKKFKEKLNKVNKYLLKKYIKPLISVKSLFILAIYCNTYTHNMLISFISIWFPLFKDNTFVLIVLGFLLFRLLLVLFNLISSYIDNNIKKLYSFLLKNKKDNKAINNINKEQYFIINKYNMMYTIKFVVIDPHTRKSMIDLGINMTKYDSLLEIINESLNKPFSIKEKSSSILFENTYLLKKEIEFLNHKFKKLKEEVNKK